jgi:hypothetical protein
LPNLGKRESSTSCVTVWRHTAISSFGIHTAQINSRERDPLTSTITPHPCLQHGADNSRGSTCTRLIPSANAMLRASSAHKPAWIHVRNLAFGPVVDRHWLQNPQLDNKNDIVDFQAALIEGLLCMLRRLGSARLITTGEVSRANTYPSLEWCKVVIRCSHRKGRRAR